MYILYRNRDLDVRINIFYLISNSNDVCGFKAVWMFLFILECLFVCLDIFKTYVCMMQQKQFSTPYYVPSSMYNTAQSNVVP